MLLCLIVGHLYDASLVLEDFSSKSRIPSIIKRLDPRSLWSPFGWSTMRNFSEGPALSIRHFQKVEREVIYFPYVVRNKLKAAVHCLKIVVYTVKIVKFLVPIISEQP